MDRTVPFVRLALDDSPAEAAEILQDAEQRHGLRWVTLMTQLPENQRAWWYEQHLWPFLSDTHLVLAAGDLFVTGCSIVDTAGVDHTPTWRHWGEIVSVWANRHWFPRPEGLGLTGWCRARRPWEYLDFYDHGALSNLVAEYDAWREAVWRVLSLTGGGDVPVVTNGGG